MEDCVFCRIVKGELPARIELETEQVIVFHDIQPQAKLHLLAIPKKHLATMNELEQSDASLLADMVFALRQIAQQHGVTEYRLVNNCGREAGQIVFHLHMHLLGGEKLGPAAGTMHKA